MSEFLYNFNEIVTLINKWRNKNKVIVITNGCFDILHVGHVKLLKRAKELGDRLIIALNSDESVRRLKGSGRPINTLKDRAFLLSALRFVDAVTYFEEDTPYKLYKGLCPDILVKGGDYKEYDVIGREFAKKVVIIPFVEGYSTTSILLKAKGGQLC